MVEPRVRGQVEGHDIVAHVEVAVRVDPLGTHDLAKGFEGGWGHALAEPMRRGWGESRHAPVYASASVKHIEHGDFEIGGRM